jgi:large subunit ribosomal protein L21
MHAVIKTGGKQYRVAAGDRLKVELLPSDVGDEVTLDQVLAVSNGEKALIGEPLVDGAKVSATVIDQGRADKVRIFKMRRRKGYRKTQGHRQMLTEIFVSKIESSLGADSVDAADALDAAKARRIAKNTPPAKLSADDKKAAAIAAAAGAASAAAASAPAATPAPSPEPEAAPEAKPEATPAPQAKASGEADDLTKIEGIGPKIAEILQEASISTFAELAQTTPEKIKELLTAAGNRFASHDPDTWPEQAQMAADGKWDELNKWQDELDGGRRV